MAELLGAGRDSDAAYSFRPLGRDRGDEMLAVNRNCPIEATFTVVFERAPDFFGWPEAVFERSFYPGVFCGRELVGYGLIGLRSGWTGGEWGRYFYLGDVRVLPAHRGRRLSRKMFDRVGDYVPDAALVPLGFFLVNRGNRAAERLATTTSDGRYALTKIGGCEIVNILLVRTVREPEGVRVRRARPEDLPALVDLLRTDYRGRLFAPDITEEALAEAWRTVPGLSLDGVLVAERDGGLVGTLTLWDLDLLRRTLVLRYPPKARLLRAAYRLFGPPFGRAEPLPPQGRAFRALTATQVAVRDADRRVAQALLASAINQNLERGYHMIQIGFADNDPLRDVVDRWLVSRYPSAIFLMTVPDRLPAVERSLARPPYIDAAAL